MSTNYRNGTDFERQVKTKLEQDGYWCIKAGGSRGKVDVLAIKREHQLFIQAKTDGVCSPADRAELIRIAGIIDGLPLIAYRDRGVRFRLLNGPGPKDWVAWTTDEIGDVA